MSVLICKIRVRWRLWHVFFLSRGIFFLVFYMFFPPLQNIPTQFLDEYNHEIAAIRFNSIKYFDHSDSINLLNVILRNASPSYLTNQLWTLLWKISLVEVWSYTMRVLLFNLSHENHNRREIAQNILICNEILQVLRVLPIEHFLFQLLVA